MRELPAAEQDLCLLDVSLRNPPKQGIDFPLLTLPLHWAVEGAYCSIVGVRTPEILSSPEPGAAAGLLLSQFPVSAGVKLQLLHTTKEVQKPSVSAGVLW